MDRKDVLDKKDLKEENDDEEDEDDEEENLDSKSINLDLSDLSSIDSSLQEELNMNNINFDEYDIWIIDPWKQRLKKETWDNIIQINSKINIQFVKRIRKDQGKEGSCVLCSLARILYTIHSVDFDNNEEISLRLKENLSNPIPDFIAYITSYIFRNCI